MYKLGTEMKTIKVCYTGLHDTILWGTITSYQAAHEAIALSQTLVTSPPFLVYNKTFIINAIEGAMGGCSDEKLNELLSKI